MEKEKNHLLKCHPDFSIIFTSNPKEYTGYFPYSGCSTRPIDNDQLGLL